MNSKKIEVTEEQLEILANEKLKSMIDEKILEIYNIYNEALNQFQVLIETSNKCIQNLSSLSNKVEKNEILNGIEAVNVNDYVKERLNSIKTDYTIKDIINENIDDNKLIDFSQYEVQSNLKKILNDMNKDYMAIERATGIPHSTFSDILSSKRPPSVNNLYRLCIVLRKHAWELFPLKKIK